MPDLSSQSQEKNLRLVNQKAIEDYENRKFPVQEKVKNLTPILKDHRAFVNYWIEQKKKLFITPKDYKSIFVDYLEVLNEHNKDCLEFKELKVPFNERLNKSDLKDVLSSKEDELKQEVDQKFVEQFLSKKENTTLARNFLEALTGGQNPLDFAVFCHFLQNIKRKMLRIGAKDHLMIILYGPTGTGKSEAVKRLFGPFKHFLYENNDYITTISIDAITERSAFLALTEKYVVFLDEMVLTKTVDVNNLKKVITEDTVSGRLFYQNSIVSRYNTASFIGACNDRLFERFSDPTGMRRYYELNVSKPTDRKTINKINYIKLLKGIHIDKDYLHGFRDQLKNYQNLNIVKDHVEDFFDQTGLMPGDDLYKCTKIYDNYQNFCTVTGNKKIEKTRQHFAPYFNKFEFTMKKNPSDKCWYAYINASSYEKYKYSYKHNIHELDEVLKHELLDE